MLDLILRGCSLPDGRQGIDIGIDYDNTSTPLRLAWSEAGYGATFDPYPSVPCNSN